MKNLYFSRVMNLFGLVTLLFLFIGSSGFAQQIITEHTLGNLDRQTIHTSNFFKSDYTQVLDKNNTQVFVKNKSASQEADQGENATNGVNLSINFVFDASQLFVSSVLIFDEAGYMQTWTYQNLTNPFIVNIPEGTYDIITEFQPLNDLGKTHVIIKEQQEIQINTTLQINATNATNYVSTTVYNENGEILDTELGAGGYLFFYRWFYFNPLQEVTLGDNYIFANASDWNFYINDVSSRYSVIQTLNGAGYAQGGYFSKFETITGIDAPISIENDPTAWSYHTEMFQPTQTADDPLAPAYLMASTLNGNLIANWTLSAGGVINSGDAPFRAFINNPMDGDPADLLVIPAVVDRFVSYSTTTGGVEYLSKGNSIYSDGNGRVLYGSGDVSFNSHADPNYAIKPFLGDDYYFLENSEVKLLPLHSRFSFDKATTPSVTIGDNVPITITGFKKNKLHIENKGRYGETRESDYLATQIEVKQNGSVVYSGPFEDFENLPSSGDIELVLTNNNILVDGIVGKNTTTMRYNVDVTDTPPTLQHLQFRSSDGQVTSVLDSNEGATLRLAAGDFLYTNIDSIKGYYSYEEGNNVTVSYSTYNQNIWTELSLTKYPAYFQMPAFGDYYEASLGDIRNANDNVWYDLKVICTDANGNVQQQVISPAFKVSNSLGMEDQADSRFAVYPNPFSDELNILLPENSTGNYTFTVTDLTGRMVYSNKQSDTSFSWNGSYLSQGVYILSIEKNDSRIIKKVVKM